MDTKFWSKVCRCGLEAYLYEFFHRPIWIPTSVWKETVDPRQRNYKLYRDCLRMAQAVEDHRVVVSTISYEPINKFGAGEADAIGLALRLSTDLLIDDIRAYREATDRGITVISCPGFLTELYQYGYIKYEQALELIEVLRPVTSHRLVEEAKDVIESITANGSAVREAATSHDV